jgi:hypothetical protein
VSPEGVFTASAAGSVTVTAVIDGVSGSTEITVVDATVASLTGLPASVSLAQGETRTLSAHPRSQSGGTVQAQVAWRSSATSVVTVSPGGEVQAVAPGTAFITASAGGVSQSVDVTVEAPTVDARTAITEVVASYARALESGDMEAVRRAYPGMTAEQEQNLRLSIESIERADFRVVSFQEEGDAATATVEGTYGFVTNGRRTTSQPFTFRATFARSGAVWRMIRTE